VIHQIAGLQEAIVNGHVAVTVFFVISGFVLCLSIERGPQTYFCIRDALL
jgi:peptidoglycan/LPS O-acetylase OafA/YrhL